MAKKIYTGRLRGHINQRFVNLVINQQLQIWDTNNFFKYKNMYLISKVWVLLEPEFDFPIPKQLTPSIKPKIIIENQKQQSFIPVLIKVTLISPNVTPSLTNRFIPAPVNVTSILSNVTLNLANTFGLISFIYYKIVITGLSQIDSLLPINLLQQSSILRKSLHIDTTSPNTHETNILNTSISDISFFNIHNHNISTFLSTVNTLTTS